MTSRGEIIAEMRILWRFLEHLNEPAAWRDGKGPERDLLFYKAGAPAYFF